MNKASENSDEIDLETVKYCETEEEVRECIKPSAECASAAQSDFDLFNYENKNVIIALSEDMEWRRPSEPPQVAERTFTDKIAQWGTNFLYNAKSGNSIWYALLGDKKPDATKPIRLLDREFNIDTKEGYVKFISAFKKLVWVTYRRDFFPLLKDGTCSSDNGWGCTVRVGQMALANALVRHFSNNSHQLLPRPLYERAITDFWDSGSGKDYPFSIQNFYKVGQKYGVKPGEWLGQTMVASILQDLEKLYSSYKMPILTFVDGAIYRSKFRSVDAAEVARDGFEVVEYGDCDEYVPGQLVFVSSSLGMKAPETSHLPALQRLFNFPELVGVMGGRTNEALFFVGYQDDDFLFLDPHFVQNTPGKKELKDYFATYHCNVPKVINYSKMDVSVCIVFYVPDDAKHCGDFLGRMKKYSETSEALVQCYDKPPVISEFDNCEDSLVLDND